LLQVSSVNLLNNKGEVLPAWGCALGLLLVFAARPSKFLVAARFIALSIISSSHNLDENVNCLTCTSQEISSLQCVACVAAAPDSIKDITTTSRALGRLNYLC
jgi:hypothetical protein